MMYRYPCLPASAILLTLAVAALALTSCSSEEESAAAPVLETRKKVASGSVEEVYALVASADQEARSLKQYRKRFDEANMSVMDRVGRWAYKKASYSVDTVEVAEDGTRAMVMVTARMPDIREVMQESSSLRRSLGGFGRNPDPDEVLAEVRSAYQEMDKPKATEAEKSFAVREDGSWKVLMGWRADELAEQAEAFRREGQLDSALARYGRAAEANPYDEGIADSRAELAERMRVREAKTRYATEGLRYVEMRLGEDPNDSYYADEGIYGTLVNVGDSTIRHLELKFWLIGAEGDTVGTEDTYVVNRFSGEPLAPGDSAEVGAEIRGYDYRDTERYRQEVEKLTFE